VTNQVEIIAKRIDDVETRNSKKFKHSNSTKSISTLNNTLYDEDESGFKNISEFKINEIHSDLNEWKKDIEKSIEKISEKVASYNSNVLINILERRINDMNNDISKIKKIVEENLDNSTILKKNYDKFDKSERLVNDLSSQIASIKNSNLQYQSEMLKNFNDVKEKILSHEVICEQFDKFERNTNKKIEILNYEYNKINNSLKEKDEDKINIFEKISDIEEKTISDIIKLNNKSKEDTQRIESKFEIK
jgi:hypothetical protein